MAKQTWQLPKITEYWILHHRIALWFENFVIIWIVSDLFLPFIDLFLYMSLGLHHLILVVLFFLLLDLTWSSLGLFLYSLTWLVPGFIWLVTVLVLLEPSLSWLQHWLIIVTDFLFLTLHDMNHSSVDLTCSWLDLTIYMWLNFTVLDMTC